MSSFTIILLASRVVTRNGSIIAWHYQALVLLSKNAVTKRIQTGTVSNGYNDGVITTIGIVTINYQLLLVLKSRGREK